jgi:hypothetical protein
MNVSEWQRAAEAAFSACKGEAGDWDETAFRATFLAEMEACRDAREELLTALPFGVGLATRVRLLCEELPPSAEAVAAAGAGLALGLEPLYAAMYGGTCSTCEENDGSIPSDAMGLMTEELDDALQSLLSENSVLGPWFSFVYEPLLLMLDSDPMNLWFVLAPWLRETGQRWAVDCADALESWPTVRLSERLPVRSVACGQWLLVRSPRVGRRSA